MLLSGSNQEVKQVRIILTTSTQVHERIHLSVLLPSTSSAHFSHSRNNTE